MMGGHTFGSGEVTPKFALSKKRSPEMLLSEAFLSLPIHILFVGHHSGRAPISTNRQSSDTSQARVVSG